MSRSTLKKLARWPLLRRVTLPLLRMTGRDVTIAHHWWPDACVHLHTFRHRGYWFKGRAREARVMDALKELAKAGDTVIEIGAHIGYLSLHLRGIVGATGRVFVFEPGPNNLPYLHRNTRPYDNIQVIPAACGDRDGMVDFWIEDLTGQNNSLNQNYQAFDRNRRRAFSDQSMYRVTVEMMQLDTFLKRTRIKPSLIKIDVEGAENLVLKGAKHCLENIRPALIVEVTENAEEIREILSSHRYAIEEDPGRVEWTCVPMDTAAKAVAAPAFRFPSTAVHDDASFRQAWAGDGRTNHRHSRLGPPDDNEEAGVPNDIQS